MAPPKKQTLPKPLPDGFILTDTEKKRWRLGALFAQGGFGLIYLASLDVERPVSADSAFVIKVEYLENGPLFSELKFYQRAAKKDMIQKWMSNKKLKFLGIPTYWGSGQAEYKDRKYRFMAMDRLGSDLQTICNRNKGRLKPNTVLQLGKRLVDVLEYIHENEYVHADIKAANLMLGQVDPNQVYLADYGLSYRYCPEGAHKEYKENPKKGHDGTMEYTSLDAHRGVAPSRRSDLQIVGFCLVHWLCGRLPWDNVLNIPEKVMEAKARFMENLPNSVQELTSGNAASDEVASFLLRVKSLRYEDKPNYELLRGILSCSGPGLDFGPPSTPASGSRNRTEEPRTANEKRERRRVQSRAEAMEVEEEEEEKTTKRNNPKQISAIHLRAPPIYKRPQAAAEAMEDEDDEDEGQSTRPKQIAARYLRKPPVSTAQVEHMEVNDEPRPRPKGGRCERGPGRRRAQEPDSQTVRTLWRMEQRDLHNVNTFVYNNIYNNHQRYCVSRRGPDGRCGAEDAAPPVIPISSRLWWIYVGLCFLIALVTMTL